MTVLVLAEEFDASADRVVDILSAMNATVFRCDTGWFPHSLSLTAELRTEGWCGVLTTPHRQVELTDIRSVWYRSPTVFHFPHLNREERGHADREAKLGLGGTLAALPLLWVNHPGREADAGYKPRQLSTAQRCGLTVPRTLVTNDPDAVRDFTRRCGRIVIKVLGANIIGEGAERQIAYTHLLDRADLSDLTGVQETAHLFQEWVAKKYEARVIAVGRQCFSAALHASSEAAHIDWRIDYGSITCTPIDLPGEVFSGIQSYLAAFALNYAAFDFVIKPNDQWVFLEANPGGQFGFIEGATGLPISRALAALLAQGVHAE